MTETLNKILNELQENANEMAARIYQKQVTSEKVLGVNKGPVRKLAKKYLPNHALGLELWSTNIYEARIMATMILEPLKMTIKELDELLSQTKSISVIDELTFEVFETFPFNKQLFEDWVNDPDLIRQRVAWNSVIVEVHRKRVPEEKAKELIDYIQEHLVSAPEVVKYAMNRALVEIAVTHKTLTERCLVIGARLGVYKEVMVAKGCTSPYAPDWINAVLRRKV